MNSLFFKFNDKSLQFLGFNIKFTYVSKTNKLNKLSYRLNSGKYLLRLVYRIEFYKRKLSKGFLNRLNLELVSHFNRLTNNKVFNCVGKYSNIWKYIFQLEAVRSTSSGKLFLSYDDDVLISNEIFTGIKLNYSINYRRYLFSLYISKIQLTLEKVIKGFNFEQVSSCYPYNIMLDKFVIEYKKRWFFLYNNLFFDNNSRVFLENRTMSTKLNFYGLNLLKKDLTGSYNFKKIYNEYDCSVYFVASQDVLL